MHHVSAATPLTHYSATAPPGEAATAASLNNAFGLWINRPRDKLGDKAFHRPAQESALKGPSLTFPMEAHRDVVV